MNFKNRFFLIFIIGIIISSGIIISIIVPFRNNIRKITADFIPNEINSYPGHTAWLLVDIHQYGGKILDNLSINFKSNVSITFDYNIWNGTSLSRVVEVFLYPNETHLNTIIEIMITVSHFTIKASDIATIGVYNWTETYEPEINVMRETFLSYIILNTDLNIDLEDEWLFLGNPALLVVVTHFLFKSDLWELELSRHEMIPPYDWIQVYLRSRDSIRPIWAGVISSWSSTNHSITEINPPEEIFR